MTQTSRISLSFGAFSCEIEGIADPVPLLQRLVTFCEEVERRNPAFGQRIAPLAELRAALATEGPVAAEVREGKLVLSRPVAAPQAPPAIPPVSAAPVAGQAEAEGDIRSVDDIAKKAKDLPAEELSSALDRAMQQTARVESAAEIKARLPLSEYARARRPRRIIDALEITAAYAHHMLGQEKFDGVRLLSDVDQIDIGKPVTMDDKIEAFGQLLDRGTFKTTERENVFALSRAVALRYR